jgi:flagellar hook-associated protein 1
MAINDILEVGKQGMAANRQAMNTATNNIANANTPGYSRQRAVFSSNEQSFINGVRVGRGVQVKEAVRIHDTFIEKRLVEEGKSFGAAKARAETLKRVEGALTNDSGRVTDLVNNFFNDVRELSLNPEQVALRSSVLMSAQNAANGFREMGDALRNVRQDLDIQIEVDVVQINTLAKELAGLNVNIAQATARGVDAPHELEDRREIVLQELSQKLGVDSTTDQFGRKVVQIGGIGVLVNGDQVNELVTMRTPADGKKAAGSVDIFIKDGNGLSKVTSRIEEGSIGGSLHVRDSIISGSLTDLDRTAYQFATRVNEIHRGGVAADGLSGRDLLTQPDGETDASRFVKISDDVKNNPSALALGYTPDGPSDNRVALELSRLQEEKIVPARAAGEGVLDRGSQTLNESLTTLVGEIGIHTRNDDEAFQRQDSLMKQLNAYRESVSGVNLEEEAMNLMQYQTVYNASAKAMKVGSELFETLLGIVD